MVAALISRSGWITPVSPDGRAYFYIATLAQARGPARADHPRTSASKHRRFLLESPAEKHGRDWRRPRWRITTSLLLAEAARRSMPRSPPGTRAPNGS